MPKVCHKGAMAGIYRIVHVESGWEYVGSSIDIRARWNNHRLLLDTHRHVNKRLENAWHKYGSQAFEFHIIEIIENLNILIPREQYHMDHRPSSFNIAPKAGNQLGLVHHDETRARMRLRWEYRRLHPSPAVLAYRVRMRGRKQLPETIAARVAKLRGKVRSAEHIQHYREAKQREAEAHREQIDALILQAISDGKIRNAETCYEVALQLMSYIPLKSIALYNAVRRLRDEGHFAYVDRRATWTLAQRAAIEQRTPERRAAIAARLRRPQTPEQREKNRQGHLGLKQSEATKSKRKATWKTHMRTPKEIAYAESRRGIFTDSMAIGVAKSQATHQARFFERKQRILAALGELGWDPDVPCDRFPAARRLSTMLHLSPNTIYWNLCHWQEEGRLHFNVVSEQLRLIADDVAPFVRPTNLVQSTLFEEV